MKPWQYAAAGLALAGFGYAAGRFSAPDKVKTVDREVVRTVTTEDTQAREQVRQLIAQLEEAKRHTHKETKIVVLPGGARTVTRTEDTDTDKRTDTRLATDTDKRTDTQRQTETAREVVHETVVERRRPDWRVGALLGLTPTRTFGATLDRRILGPLWLGAGGLSNGTTWVGLSLEF